MEPRAAEPVRRADGTALRACAFLLVLGVTVPETAMAQSSFRHCLDLYELWARYEWHFTLHSSQRARADIALERDCRGAGQAHGLEELRKLLRRGLIPHPTDEVSQAPQAGPSRP
jgi:hypothetical protein